MSLGYPYATGALLDERQHYRYSAFAGAHFLDAWRDSRDEALASLPAPAPAAPRCARALPVGATDASTLLDALHDAASGRRLEGAARARLDLLVQRFEVGKRVFGRYDDALRAVDRDDYRDLARYLRLGEVLDAACDDGGALPYLNALLKCGDILCAHRAELDFHAGARLARLLLRERGHVAALAARVGVELAA